MWQPETLSRNESGRFGALKSYSTHHFFRNACTKSGSLRFSQFYGCWLILSVYILMSFDFPFNFNWLKCMGGFLHIKPTAGCQISTLIIWKHFCGKGRGSMNIPWKIPNGKVLAHLGFKSKVFPGPLIDISAWWVSAHQAHSRVSNINFDIWKHAYGKGEGLYEYPIKNSQRQSSCPLGV